jgi:hypothetical protein
MGDPDLEGDRGILKERRRTKHAPRGGRKGGPERRPESIVPIESATKGGFNPQVGVGERVEDGRRVAVSSWFEEKVERGVQLNPPPRGEDRTTDPDPLK